VQVLETRKRVVGKEHPSTLTSMANLASTYWNHYREEEAISLMETCIQLRKLVLGGHHPDTQSSLQTLTEWQMENVQVGN
jgi:hypothetical protein